MMKSSNVAMGAVLLVASVTLFGACGSSFVAPYLGSSRVEVPKQQVGLNPTHTAAARTTSTAARSSPAAAFAALACASALVARLAPGRLAPAGAQRRMRRRVRCTATDTTDTTPITEAEVLDCQAKWATAIKTISKTYLDKGDYVTAAGDAAAELYGYGHSNVLFKPTKAAEFPFRPTGGEAMSYFVGGSAVDNGYSEDAGFAINGGKGWKEVVFTNHQIDLNGPVAVAMGTYVFTCATTGDEAKVEYTFGYKRNSDGKARIFLHHSSVPYKA